MFDIAMSRYHYLFIMMLTNTPSYQKCI